MLLMILNRKRRGSSPLDEADDALRDIDVNSHGVDHCQADDGGRCPGRMRRAFFCAETWLIASGLDESARINESTGNDPVERSNNLGVGNQRLKFVDVSLGLEI